MARPGVHQIDAVKEKTGGGEHGTKDVIRPHRRPFNPDPSLLEDYKHPVDPEQVDG